MLSQTIILALLTALTSVQGVPYFHRAPAYTIDAHVQPSTGDDCHTVGLQRPLFVSNTCSARPEPELEHPPRPPRYLEGQLPAIDPDGRQTSFSIGSSAQLAEEHNLKHRTGYPKVTSPSLEIVPLIVSGPSTNRVDLVFFSDGYVTYERDKFIDDARRLAQDVSANQTFNTVQPLLNFWAAFSPSKESGIGTGGVPKDTPFGLYRDGTELRAVYYSKPEVAKAACDSLGNRCNYPILLGNDPLYGGLGGEFTVITSSILNGPLVLRHELGHSIIKVGEEYDGGYSYFGVNAAHDLSKPIPWKHWLSNPLTGTVDDMTKERLIPRVERSVMPMQVYPWTMLNTTSPWSIKFTSSGSYSRHVVRFSLSGLSQKEDLQVALDGVDLGWVPKPGIGLDRWHYDIHSPKGLGPGYHELIFTLVNKKRRGVAQLCSAEILEFGNEDEFISKPGFYSLYPTYSDLNETSYRPTNEDCLMRVVTSPDFCKVCTEKLWLYLLERVDFIDNISESCVRHRSGSFKSSLWSKVIDLHLLPLAHLRQTPVSTDESYTITWKKDGSLLPEFTNNTRIEVDNENAMGEYTIEVKFATEEVRLKSKKLVSGVHYTVETKCGSVAESFLA